jgi:hypothetical protein
VDRVRARVLDPKVYTSGDFLGNGKGFEEDKLLLEAGFAFSRKIKGMRCQWSLMILGSKSRTYQERLLVND